MNERYVLAGLALLIFAAIITIGGIAGASTTAQPYDLGDEHGLATNDSAETYEEAGIASTNVSGLSARLTIAEDHEDVGLDAYTTDFNYHYVRVQYNESIERTLTFDLPESYFSPYPADGIEARNADVTADLQPVDNATATEMTVHLTGETDAVFRISKSASMVFGARDTATGFIERATGYELPSLFSSDSEWTRVPDSAWAKTNATPAIETTDDPLMIQYDASDTAGEHRWISVPECGNAQDYETVCRMTRNGTDAALLLAQDNDTPVVRYRHGRSLFDQGRAALNEIIEGFEEGLDGLLGPIQGGLF